MNHEIKRNLLLGRKVMTNLDSILKSRDITLPTEVHLVRAMVFPVVMYGCESWTVKEAEHWRIDAFELWSWRRLLRVPWTARRSIPVHPKGDQSWMFIGRTDAEAETPILWPPHVKCWLIVKGSDLGGIGSRRRRGRQSMRWLDGITNSVVNCGSWWWTGRPGVLQFMGSQRVGHDWATELTETPKGALASLRLHKTFCKVLLWSSHIMLTLVKWWWGGDWGRGDWGGGQECHTQRLL